MACKFYGTLTKWHAVLPDAVDIPHRVAVIMDTRKRPVVHFIAWSSDQEPATVIRHESPLCSINPDVLLVQDVRLAGDRGWGTFPTLGTVIWLRNVYGSRQGKKYNTPNQTEYQTY